MSLVTPDLGELPAAPAEMAAAVPPAEFVFAPASPEEAARVFDAASERRASVLVWGAGTHQGIGHPVAPDVVVTTARLDRVIAWEPDDLTLVAEAGVTVGRIEEMLAERGQTALLPETGGEATLGGVIAAGVSGYRRGRFGPTRDRVLQVNLVTGDGRLVTGGGRVVKNVSGYDLPRIATGSLGSLGMIASVCLKLWPVPEASATVRVANPAEAWRVAYRPLAVLETRSGSFVYLQGTEAEVASQGRVLGGEVTPGLQWPTPVEAPAVFSIRVPPAMISEVVGWLPDDGEMIAQHGVGEVTFGVAEPDPDRLTELRRRAEEAGGALVTVGAPDGLADRFDPWGSPPPGQALQRRLIAAFDPARVVNPGRLPGGL